MPDILVEVRGSWLGARKRSFLLAIHDAVIEALKSDPEDKVVRLIEHASVDFLIPAQASDRFTHIEITQFVGRSIDTKRMLYRAMVRHLEPFGISAHDIKIVLKEVPLANVGMRGGRAACDIDISYDIQV
ncbi:tautomerase family protein [Bradyrhizobium prioriisuperbiae]|uniref:tautomerase family protein n=1 Tax=Bradyrhizobium prioriisuperbiae TaxID=2854389 RepID=UPI0028EDB86B|nr:tautomerase family protein [Bradyrhizobium prioritasuperba]